MADQTDTLSSDNSSVVILKQLLKEGIIIASVATCGSFILGPCGGFLGTAASAVLRLFINYGGENFSSWCNSALSNPLVKWLVDLLISKMLNFTIEKLGKSLKNLAEFLNKLTQSGPLAISCKNNNDHQKSS